MAGSAQAGLPFDAAADGDVAETNRLLSQNVDVDERGGNRETPLHAAALAGHTDIAAALVENGADVMARDKGARTPLHAAAYSGSIEIAKLLLDKGAALEDRDNFSGATPLIVASEENRVAVAALFIARGADINVPDRDGFSPLTAAWGKGSFEVPRLLKANWAVCQPVEVLGAENYRWKCVETGG